MPSTTNVYKLPYVLATDKISDYPATSKNLADRIDSLLKPSTAQISPYTGWKTTATLKTSAAVHKASIVATRTAAGFTTTPNGAFQIATLPPTLPQPTDGELIGIIQFDSYSAPLKYIASTRGIVCEPTASFPVNKQSTGLGTITWIA